MEFDKNTVFTMIALIGILLKLFLNLNTTSDGESGPATVSLWSFGLIIVSLCLIFLSLLQNYTIKLILVLVGILLYQLSLNIIYFYNINKGEVAEEYNQYSSISSLLILVQIMIIFHHVNNLPNGNDNIIYFCYLLGLITLIITGMMHIVLKYFSTDG